MENEFSKSKGCIDTMRLKDMALNLAKSAAILSDRIVPILLQAASLSHKLSPKMSEEQLFSMLLGSTTGL